MVMGTGDLYKIQNYAVSQCACHLLWPLALQLVEYVAGQWALVKQKKSLNKRPRSACPIYHVFPLVMILLNWLKILIGRGLVSDTSKNCIQMA